jgi:hypothetical protein
MIRGFDGDEGFHRFHFGEMVVAVGIPKGSLGVDVGQVMLQVPDRAVDRHMLVHDPTLIVGMLQALDFVVVSLAGYAAFVLYLVVINGETVEFVRYGVISLLGAVPYVALMRQAGAHAEGGLFKSERLWRRATFIGRVTFALLVGVGFMLKLSSTYSRGRSLLWLVFSLAGISTVRSGLFLLTRSWRQRGLLLRKLAVVGAGSAARDLTAK